MCIGHVNRSVFTLFKSLIADANLDLAILSGNRAWLILSTAVRFALALGYHQRQRPSDNLPERQTNSQTWWTLHNLESLLSSIIGKPCMLSNENMTVALPSEIIPVSQASPDDPTMSFQDAQAHIATYTQRILSNLYIERRTPKRWPQIQSTITTLLSSLNKWRPEAMPDHLHSADVNPVLEHQQILLKKQYLRLVILITRPCLQRLQLHVANANAPSLSSLDKHLAETCIRAAQDVVAILPTEVNTRALYTKGPWWSIVHNCTFSSLSLSNPLPNPIIPTHSLTTVMQSSAILLIALSLRTHFPPPLIETCISSFRKIISWLLAMRSANDLAQRAYLVLRNFVKRAGETGTWPEILGLFPEEDE